MVDVIETDNDISAEIATASTTVNTLTLTLRTDNYANETYWQVANSSGDVVASGGNAGVGMDNTGIGAGSPPADPGSYGNNTTITEEIQVPSDDCYTFTITDYWGDGICCSYGNGFYELVDHEGNVIEEGASFSAREDKLYEGEMLVNVIDPTFNAAFHVAPNPVKDVAQLAFSLSVAANTNINVVNNLGQIVLTQQLGQLPTGQHNYNLDMNGLSPGVYIIKINAGNLAGTKKVILAK